MTNNISTLPRITESSTIVIPNSNESILQIWLDSYKLADIFINDLGYIRKKENEFAYTKLLKSMLYKTNGNFVMQILGHCAEAVTVRRCNENPEINRRWLDIANKWVMYDITIPYETMAIGTGLDYTKNNYRYYYNPNDTQRDIIWINKETKIPFVSGYPYGDYIGLQIKTSRDGKNNIEKALITKKYYVPIVYFDIFNDYQKIKNDIKINGYDGNLDNDFISAKEIDFDAYYEVRHYYEIINALYYQKIPVEKFISIAMQMHNLGSATIKAITSIIPETSNSIITSKI
ncbi:MAG: hypothetical protein K2I06_05605 [Ruminococcus sp.]|nr:hypothetical protein [Ruminococcus sp.]